MRLFNRNPLPFPALSTRGGPQVQKNPLESWGLRERVAPGLRDAAYPAQPIAHDAVSADGGARRRALPVGATSSRSSSIAGYR